MLQGMTCVERLAEPLMSAAQYGALFSLFVALRLTVEAGRLSFVCPFPLASVTWVPEHIASS